MFMAIERLDTIKPGSRAQVHLRTAFFLPGFYPSVNRARVLISSPAAPLGPVALRSLSLNQAGTLGANTLEFFPEIFPDTDTRNTAF